MLSSDSFGEFATDEESNTNCPKGRYEQGHLPTEVTPGVTNAKPGYYRGKLTVKYTSIYLGLHFKHKKRSSTYQAKVSNIDGHATCASPERQ